MLKRLANRSYSYRKHDSDTDTALNGFQVDKRLSGRRVQVYHNEQTDETYVVHRGTQGLQDWYTDAKLLFGGFHSTNRYKHAKEIQAEAEEKYGSENITTLGHSLGGRLARELGGQSRKIFTLNAPTIPSDLLTPSPNVQQTDYRNILDPVSILRVFELGGDVVTTRRLQSINPLTSHSVDYLNIPTKETEPPTQRRRYNPEL